MGNSIWGSPAPANATAAVVVATTSTEAEKKDAAAVKKPEDEKVYEWKPANKIVVDASVFDNLVTEVWLETPSGVEFSLCVGDAVLGKSHGGRIVVAKDIDPKVVHNVKLFDSVNKPAFVFDADASITLKDVKFNFKKGTTPALPVVEPAPTPLVLSEDKHELAKA